MEEIAYRIVGNNIVRKIQLKGRGIKTSKLPIPDWVDRKQPTENIYDLAWLASKERPRVRASAQEIRAVDLFCGCGGLTLGIREAARGLGCAFRSVFASDVNKGALDVYTKNFQPDIADDKPIEESINGELGAEPTPEEQAFCNKVGDIDILVAGPPCQGHSNLNNHTRRDDPRNLLYLRAVRCAEILKPDTLIIENVPGVLHDKHGVLQTADDYLKTLGYSVDFDIIRMWKIGVAQTRQRMLLVASRVAKDVNIGEIMEKFTLPTRTLEWVIGDLLDKYTVDNIFDSAAVHSPDNQARIHYLFENDLYELPNEQRPDCHRLKPHTYPSVYGRMHWDRPSPTITGGFPCCGRGRFVHPLRERTLTPHEAARIQYFPDFFDFNGMTRSGLAHAIGNAVPPRAGYVVALPLLMTALEVQSQKNKEQKPQDVKPDWKTLMGLETTAVDDTSSEK